MVTRVSNVGGYFSSNNMRSGVEEQTSTPPCDNILSGYLCAVTTVFSQQDGIYGFKYPKRFFEISFRDLTLFSTLFSILI